MAQRVTVNQSVGFVFMGRVIKWDRLDSGSFLPMRRDHRDGQHKATRTTDCGECLSKFRREVLGHAV